MTQCSISFRIYFTCHSKEMKRSPGVYFSKISQHHLQHLLREVNTLMTLKFKWCIKKYTVWHSVCLSLSHSSYKNVSVRHRHHCMCFISIHIIHQIFPMKPFSNFLLPKTCTLFSSLLPAVISGMSQVTVTLDSLVELWHLACRGLELMGNAVFENNRYWHCF